MGVGSMSDTRTVAEEAVEAGTCAGVQVRVLPDGRTVVDFALGEESPGVPLTTGSVLPWFSAQKLPTTLAFARAWALGLPSQHDLVRDQLPEFTGDGRAAITVRHLWSRAAAGRRPGRGHRLRPGLGSADRADLRHGRRSRPGSGAAGGLSRPCRVSADRQVHRPPQRRRVRRVPADGDDRAARSYRHPWRPARFPGGAGAQLRARRDRHDRRSRRPVRRRPGLPRTCVAVPFGEAAVAEIVGPADSTAVGGYCARRPCTALVRDHRPEGVVDEVMGVPVRWGPGLMPDTFGFGRHCSPRAFGHTGGSACVVLSDPDAGVPIAAHFNGTAPLADRIRHDHALCTAVYTNRGGAGPKDAGRDHAAPVLGVISGRPQRLVSLVRWCDSGGRGLRRGESRRANGTRCPGARLHPRGPPPVPDQDARMP
ncbi:hypothetical protein AV521_03570 [Streptomyces sp. IMTB 2501]|nr:hypothetical protein AV521_03570 [Streptomyces sp. IMTB 2501]